MSELLDEFTPTQRKAITAFKRAFTMMKNTGLTVHNCYGHLTVYQKDCVEFVDDEKHSEEEHQCEELGERFGGEMWNEWADDKHFIHLTEKGRKEIEGPEEDE